jgi:Reverse transcriptase (RNA-dependent DNA polymerase)
VVHPDNKPFSRTSPIAHPSALASILSLGEDELAELASSVACLWKPGKLLKKKNGEPRQTSDAKPQLKKVHERIKNRLLKQVEYPQYLLGGIADSMMPRDYKRHAAIHSGKKIVISEDIRDFFPSTTEKVVEAIWRRFFHFSPGVADTLTKLTTFDGSLPQGWKASGYLANLAFWDKEPDLVSLFARRGFVYSRFMDDITVSCRFKLTDKNKQFIISEIYGMLFSKGYAPKRSKHQIPIG